MGQRCQGCRLSRENLCGSVKGGSFMSHKKEVEVVIDTDEIRDYLFFNLVKRGYSPSVKEATVISDILFDFLVEKDVIEEE
jgi:hypothetical protein